MYNDKISVNYLKKNYGVSSKQIFCGDVSCYLNSLFRNIERLGYNCGIYGWNYDIFKIKDYYIVTGYRYPEIKQYLSYEKLKELDNRFKKQQETLNNKFYRDKKIKNSYTYNRLFNNLIEKQKEYFIKKLPKLLYKGE